MTLPNFERALLALGETVALERQPHSKGALSLGKGAAEFLLAVHMRMPDYLRPPFHILVLVFDVWPVVRKGRLFHRLNPEDRLVELNRWRRSRIEIRRRLVEFYTTLAVFGMYSDLYGQDYDHGDVHSVERARS